MADAARFITFEGGEGAGKSTQIKVVAEALARAGIPHILTREPGGSAGAEAIRELIVTGQADRWDPVTETLLIMAARNDHIFNTVQPALVAGTWVLCDRFLDSTRVYQGIAKQVNSAWLEQLHRLLFGSLLPDVTVLLDIDPSIGLQRAAERKGNEMRFEGLPLHFHQTLREGFLHLAQREPQRFVVVDAAVDAAQVSAMLLAQLSQRLQIELTHAAS